MNTCLRKRLRSAVVSEFFEPQKTIFPLPNLIHATDGHQKLRHTTSHQRGHFEVSRNQIEQMVLGEVLCAKKRGITMIAVGDKSPKKCTTCTIQLYS